METLGTRLRRLMKAEGRADAILHALLERAEAGDLKAVQMVLDLSGEGPKGRDGEPPVVRVEFAPEAEEYAK